MQRFLYRVTYTLPDGMAAVPGVSTAYEPVCVRAADDDEAAARAEVEAATARYVTFVGATRAITLVLVTADV